jgi:hypothetical protein
VKSAIKDLEKGNIEGAIKKEEKLLGGSSGHSKHGGSSGGSKKGGSSGGSKKGGSSGGSKHGGSSGSSKHGGSGGSGKKGGHKKHKGGSSSSGPGAEPAAEPSSMTTVEEGS